LGNGTGSGTEVSATCGAIEVEVKASTPTTVVIPC